MTHIEGLYEVSINGVGFRVVQEQYARRFLDVIRQQAGSQEEPSEFSLNPNDLWRRSQEDWVFGSGQKLFDDDESTRKRYHFATGWDPLESKGDMQPAPGHLEVLAPDAASLPTTDDFTKMVVADGYIWIMVESDTRVIRWDGATATASGAAPQNVVDIATDGSNVYLAVRDAAKSTGGVYVISAGSTTPVLLNSTIPDLIDYEMGRLMVAAGPDLFNITDLSSTDAPDALTSTAVNDNFVWDAFGSANNFILASGHAGDLSLVYRITIREDGTALTAPVVAAQMPDTEHVRVFTQYLGVVVIGTTKGIRIATMDNGTLSVGPLVEETLHPVTGLEPQGRFVYYGTGGAMGSPAVREGAGLHRLDLSRFLPNFDLVPVHAFHLGTSAVTQIHDVVFFDGDLHFAQATTGLVRADGTTVQDGTSSFHTGQISYGMTDKKNFRFIDVHASTPSDSSITVHWTDDEGNTGEAGTIDASNGPKATFALDVEAEWLDLRVDGSPETVNSPPQVGPTLHRLTLRALPTPSRTEQIQVMLDLRAGLTTMAGASDFHDAYAEFETLRGYVKSGETVTYKEFDTSYDATVENVQWGPDLDVAKDNDTWEGNCLVTLRVYS